MTALDEAELDHLEKYLNAPGRLATTLPLDAIQGLFAALACATPPVPREK